LEEQEGSSWEMEKDGLRMSLWLIVLTPCFPPEQFMVSLTL